MSDETEEKRPRLQLSRDLKTPETEAPKETAAPTEAQPAPKKLQISKPTVDSDSSNAAVPQPPSQSTASQSTAPSDKGSGDTPPPPPIPKRVAPPPTPQAAPQAEPIDSTLEQLEGSQKSNSTLISILMFFVLFLILAAAGGGIWWVLRAPADSETPNTATVTSDTTVSAPVATPDQATPIARAKAAIASVPVAEVPDFSVVPVTPAQPAPLAQPQPQVAPPQAAHQKIERPAPQRPARASSELQQTVTAFLADIHIGGVRSGTNPRVMINGESYNPGDLIDETTGLTFAGIKDGRLLFKDRNGIYYAKSF